MGAQTQIQVILLVSIALAYYASLVTSQEIYGVYRFNDAQKQQVLAIHNRLRAAEPASNMQALVWDDRLANLAFGHVQRCDAWHRSAYERRGHGYTYIGENIWWSNEAHLRANLQSAMLDFYNEKPFYDYWTMSCRPGEQCGHYTQFVWADTCAVGCAAVYCNGIRNGRGINRGHIIVCNYGEGGNHYGRRPYKYGARCSQCPCGSCTADGLCAPCCLRSNFPIRQQLPRPQPQAPANWRPRASKPNLNTQRKITKLQKYCVDLDANCGYWARNDGCAIHRAFMSVKCPATCNLCAPKSWNANRNAPLADECIDQNRNCQWWSQHGACRGAHAAYMSQYCRLSCRICQKMTSVAVTTTNGNRRNARLQHNRSRDNVLVRIR